MEHVYEIVDATSDEQYWPLGIFPTLAEATAALSGCREPPSDNAEEFCRIEVRERAVGWGDLGKCVHVQEWVSYYDELADEWKWKLKPQPVKA